MLRHVLRIYEFGLRIQIFEGFNYTEIKIE